MASEESRGRASADAQTADGAAGQPSPAAIEAAVAPSPLMARLDVAVTGLLVLIGAALTVAMPSLVVSGGIETERDFATLSPELIPRLTFGTLTILAIAAFIPAVDTLRVGGGQPRAEEPGRLLRAGIGTLIAVAYAASVTWLGYILATMLMTLAMSWYLGLRNPLAFVPGVVVIPITIKFVFERLLLIALPRSSVEGIGLVEDATLRFLSKLFFQ